MRRVNLADPPLEYDDSDKIAIHTGRPKDDVVVRRSSGVDYFDGEGPAE